MERIVQEQRSIYEKTRTNINKNRVMTLLTAIRLILKRIKVSKVHIHVLENGKEVVVHTFKTEELWKK